MIKDDLRGKRFGMLVAIEPTDQRKCGGVMWRCRCDCGNEKLVLRNNLVTGAVKSCGCGISNAAQRNAKDITAMRFGKLTAIKPTKDRFHSSVIWECRCDCGNTCYKPASVLKSGIVKSCGCLQNGRNRIKKGSKNYSACIMELPNYTDRDAYISDLALSSLWEDAPGDDIPEERVERLGRIWDAYHRPIKEIAKEAGLSQRKLAERFCIPYRTMEQWCSGNRVPPDYVRMMMQECLGFL